MNLDIAGYDRKTCHLLSCDILPPPHLLLLLLLTPNKILKKTENRVLLSVSEWGPSTVGRTRKKEKLKKKTYNAIKRLENTDEEKYIFRAMHCRGERKVGRM